MAFQKFFSRFARICFAKTDFLLKCSAFVAYLDHAVLLNFIEAFKWCQVQSVHSLLVFLPVEHAAEQQSCNNELAEIKESLGGYSSSGVLEVRHSMVVTFSTDGKEL